MVKLNVTLRIIPETHKRKLLFKHEIIVKVCETTVKANIASNYFNGDYISR